MAAAWYCVNSKPRRETLASAHLNHQGYEVYLPVLQTTVKLGPHITKQVDRPLFPGYLFVRFDMEDRARRWQSIHSTVGVKRLFSNADVPVALTDDEMAVVRSIEQSTRKYHDLSADYIEPGTKVRIVDGKFDLTGICQWSDARRVALLTTILHREVVITVNRNRVRAE
jgi:transcriptional antiterminator RfaH